MFEGRISKKSPEPPAWFPSLPGSISSCWFVWNSLCVLVRAGQLEVDLFSVDFMAMLLLQATALV